MTRKETFNFSAGPSVLPEEVLAQAQAELLDYHGTGMSVMEMSHRSQAFSDIFQEVQARFRSALSVPDTHAILFLQGGGTSQFSMIPLNLMGEHGTADYAVTGHFSGSAAKEAEKYGKVHIAADTSTCGQAIAIAEKYHLRLSAAAQELLRQETPKALTNVTTRITGSVRELCTAAAAACRELGYEPVLLTDRLCCEAKEAGSFLGSIACTNAGQGKKLAFIAGGETVVHLTGKGQGGRNQELALAAAPALAGQNAAVFSVGSDGTDGPTDAAGGYVDGDTLAALEAGGWNGYAALQNNDSYHALKAVDGLILTGATGTNVNDVAVALIGEKTPPVSPEVSPEW